MAPQRRPSTLLIPMKKSEPRYLRMLRNIRPGLLWLAVSCMAPAAALACTASETGGALGTVNSFRVKDGAAITGSGNFSFTCGAVVLSALGTPSLTGTIQPSVTGLTLKNGTNSIPYQVFTTSGYGTQYTGGLVVVNLNGTNLLTLLGGAGGQVPIYIQTTPGANIPAGTYTDNLQVTWTYSNICEGVLGIAGICVGIPNTGTTTRTLSITLTVSNDCTITAPTVGFGSAPLVSGFPTISQNISLLCTKGMSYTVGMNTGNNPSGGRRQMASGANRLAYDIFKADSTVWGSLTTARANGPAAADGITLQNIPYTATIYPSQTTPPAGSYSDSVMVDVSF